MPQPAPKPLLHRTTTWLGWSGLTLGPGLAALHVSGMSFSGTYLAYANAAYAEWEHSQSWVDVPLISLVAVLGRALLACWVVCWLWRIGKALQHRFRQAGGAQ
ncbi:hypothetical protein [Pseudomonas sp. BN102]|uniref:hypothetical protein n=1 Tax=Pseudomonas sp. BN102 TaxID=2567886 RepID=UPI0024544787|nr:hypothetical protein [Pseudomonas sp. BN102]